MAARSKSKSRVRISVTDSDDLSPSSNLYLGDAMAQIVVYECTKSNGCLSANLKGPLFFTELYRTHYGNYDAFARDCLEHLGTRASGHRGVDLRIWIDSGRSWMPIRPDAPLVLHLEQTSLCIKYRDTAGKSFTHYFLVSSSYGSRARNPCAIL